MTFGEFAANHTQWADIALGMLASQALYKAVGNDYYRAICFMIAIRLAIYVLKRGYEGNLFN